MHLGAIAIALGVPVDIRLRALLVVAVAASFGWQWARFRRRQDGEWRVDVDGNLFWFPDGDSGPTRYELLQAEAGALWIRLLIERKPSRRCHFFIWKDAVDPEINRELRARIEQRRLPARNPDRA